MPVFEYKAKDHKGNPVKGKLKVSDPQAVEKHLRARGYLAVQVQARRSTTSELRGRFSLGLALSPVKVRDRALFYRHLAATMKAGISPAQALHSCEPRTVDKRLRTMIRELIPRVEAGSALSELLRGYPQICPAVTADILGAAEKGGFLDGALHRIAEDLELEVEVRQQLKWHAVFMAGLIVPCLLIPPLPQMISLERLTLAGYLERYWAAFRHTSLPLILSLAAVWLVLRVGQSLPRGRRILDGVKLRLPGISVFMRNTGRSRFMTNFAYLIKAGIPVAGALRTAAPTCGIVSMQEALLAGVPAIERGAKLSDVLALSRQLGPHDLQALATGEESGMLAEALERLANHYQTEVKASLKKLGVVLWMPLLLLAGIAVACVVGMTARAYFDRLFELGDKMMEF